MTLLETLTDFIKKKDTHAKETPEGFCPNCWGREEYGGKFYEVALNSNVDINSNNPNLGWIQEYANKHLAGIKLTEQDGTLVCSKCKLSYSPSK